MTELPKVTGRDMRGVMAYPPTPALPGANDVEAQDTVDLAETEPGRLMCLMALDPPRQPHAPYEERAALHLARRAAGRGEVPAAALAEGFAEGQEAFSEAFHDLVGESPARYRKRYQRI